MKTLDGKVVVITGAGSGIGRELALNAAAKGAVLALSDKDEVGLLETAERARTRMARDVRVDKLDVSDRAAMKEYAASVREELGRVNVVVNNAGVALHGDFEETSYEHFEWIMDVNFWGVVNGTKEFLPHLIASGDGHVVNISSLFGLLGMPGQSAYNSSKFAVRGFTEALRQEMLIAKHPVEVSCVHPGGIKTAIARNARTTAAHDQATVAEFFDKKLARTTAEKAAQIIIDGILANKPRIVVGADAKFLDLWVRAVGARYQSVVARIAGRVVPKPTRSPVAVFRSEPSRFRARPRGYADSASTFGGSMTAPTHVRDLAHRHPGTLALGAVAAGAVAGWVTRGAKEAGGDGLHGTEPSPVYDEPRGRATVAHTTETGEPARLPQREHEVSPEGATGDALDPDIGAAPAPVPGDVRGGNVGDQGWNTGPTRRGAT